MAKQKLIVVVGPTASGKTGLAINIVKLFNGEVISADSRQVYKGLDIGTAKATTEEMQGVPHHLIDIVDIDTIYTADNFKKDAKKAIDEIGGRGNLPIIAGGTFFYIATLLERIVSPEVAPDLKLRAQLELIATEELFDILSEKDPRRAANIDPNNKRRLIRALEIVHHIGEVPLTIPKDPPYDVLMLGIQTDKDDLHSRLETRARAWLTGGFKEEVAKLLEDGVSKDQIAEIGFEYLLGVDLLEGNLTGEKFVEVFVQKNWQYAKRQLNWLKRDPSINWVSPADKSEVELVVKQFLLNN